MVTGVKNGHGDSSSDFGQGYLCFTMNPVMLSQAMSRIVGYTRLFGFVMTTGLGEGKFWIQTCETLLKN